MYHHWRIRMLVFLLVRPVYEMLGFDSLIKLRQSLLPSLFA